MKMGYVHNATLDMNVILDTDFLSALQTHERLEVPVEYYKAWPVMPSSDSEA